MRTTRIAIALDHRSPYSSYSLYYLFFFPRWLIGSVEKKSCSNEKVNCALSTEQRPKVSLDVVDDDNDDDVCVYLFPGANSIAGRREKKRSSLQSLTFLSTAFKMRTERERESQYWLPLQLCWDCAVPSKVAFFFFFFFLHTILFPNGKKRTRQQKKIRLDPFLSSSSFLCVVIKLQYCVSDKRRTILLGRAIAAIWIAVSFASTSAATAAAGKEARTIGSIRRW